MRIPYSIITTIAIAFAATGLSVSSNATSLDTDPFELSLEENIQQPLVPEKNRNTVKEANDKLRTTLEREGIRTSRLRKGEVLMISMPCEQLFNANSQTISQRGYQTLAKLKLIADVQGKYKLLIAVHTDDTGDTYYADTITSERANAIDDYLSNDLGLSEMIIVPYGIGRDEPLVANDSMKKRSQNRRVEIYLVPQTSLFSKNSSKK